MTSAPSEGHDPSGIAPGWYHDPWDAAQARYWDGTEWTQDVAAIPPGASLIPGGEATTEALAEPSLPPVDPLPRRRRRWLPLAAIGTLLVTGGVWLMWPTAAPTPPSTTLLTAGGTGLTGRIEAFTVADTWRVEFAFGEGAPDGAFSECSLRGEIRNPDGSPSGLPGFGAGDDPSKSPGRGSGSQTYERGGSFVITLAIPCANATDGAPMPWSVKIVD